MSELFDYGSTNSADIGHRLGVRGQIDCARGPSWRWLHGPTYGGTGASRFYQGEAGKCQPKWGSFRKNFSWPRASISECPHNVRFQRESRPIVLTLSFAELDLGRAAAVRRPRPQGRGRRVSI
jgi:hypothetical protein